MIKMFASDLDGTLLNACTRRMGPSAVPFAS